MIRNIRSIVVNMVRVAFPVAVVLVAATVIYGCAEDDITVTVKPQPVVATTPAPVEKVDEEKSSAERFGMKPAGHPDTGSKNMLRGPHGGMSAGSWLTWTTPEGWTEAPKKMMRVVTFNMGAENAVECYVSVLSGSAGGVEANVNRWRDQLGIVALTPDEVAALPTIPLLGTEAVFMEGKGTFTGMTGEGKADQALLGVVCQLPEKCIFVKMIGPADEAMKQKDNFTAFCKSIKKIEETTPSHP
ncbi:hypothetical protein ACFL1X_10845 [Candidatus Hydrogenedentota bacterium]